MKVQGPGMIRLNSILAIALFSTLGAAKDKPLPLSPEAGVQLRDKTVTITRHEKPSFVAMTAGKAAFALLGTAAMISSGNAMVRDNEIADPADIVERELAGAVIRHYGLQVPTAPSTVIKQSSTKDLLALKVESDYLLDVRSGGWNFAYYPVHWGKYWVGYSVQVQLIDKRVGAVVANLACNSSTNKHEPFPTREALLDNKAQLLKDTTSALAWQCVHLLAKEEFGIPEGVVTPVPAELVDPAATYLAAHPGAYEVKEEEGRK
jgi:hypothetical protein